MYGYDILMIDRLSGSEMAANTEADSASSGQLRNQNVRCASGLVLTTMPGAALSGGNIVCFLFVCKGEYVGY
jgi:hypothetical protein